MSTASVVKIGQRVGVSIKIVSPITTKNLNVQAGYLILTMKAMKNVLPVVLPY